MKWIVQWKTICVWEIEVEADSYEDAKRQYLDMATDKSVDTPDVELVDEMGFEDHIPEPADDLVNYFLVTKDGRLKLVAE
jgi:hypothetical protein